jgi:hypothetical protein
VSSRLVVIADTLNMGAAAEEAEALRDPSHVRNYTAEEWRELAGEAGLEITDLRTLQNTFDFEAWLQRTGCEGETAERVRELWGERVSEGRLTLDKIAINAVKT